MKRFTDTDKWKREWFCELSVKAKLVWYYILDQCDHRGVYFRNFKQMSDHVGFKVSHKEFESWFGTKVRAFDGDKYFIPSFVEFQYGKELNPANNAHKSVIQLVEYLKKSAPNEVLMSPYSGAQDKEEDKEKDKDKEKEEEGGAAKIHPLADLWNELRGDLPKVLGTNKTRSARMKERWAEAPVEEWRQVILRVACSNFCLGKNDRGWRASFDWLLQPEVRLKVMEGTYDNRTGTKGLEARDWGAEADLLIKAMKDHPSGDTEGLRRTLGDVRLGWFIKITRARIAMLPPNAIGRNQLAAQIKSIASEAVEVIA